MLGDYPIVKPRHGGQLRVRAILGAYKAAGIEARYVAIVPKDWYDDLGSQDIEIDNTILTEEKYRLAPDLAIGMHIRRNAALQRKLKTIIESYEPDIIQCEQLFTYIGIEKLLKNLGQKPLLIYSSQNVEYLLRSDMLADQLQAKPAAAKAIYEIQNWEGRLIRKADVTIVCTEADGQIFNSMGAKRILLAPNGIHRRKQKPENLVNWRKRFTDAGVNKLILFVGSAHKPNLEGFKQLVGYNMGFLPRDTKIVVVGDVYRMIEEELAELSPHVSATFRLRVDMIGKVSDDDIASLLHLADIIILPITQGGGSNLKTAEAILSEKPIVATTTSFRGYEAYRELPGILFADNQADFRCAILKACAYNTLHRTAIQKATAKKVTWSHCLQGMIEDIKGLEMHEKATQIY